MDVEIEKRIQQARVGNRQDVMNLLTYIWNCEAKSEDIALGAQTVLEEIAKRGGSLRMELGAAKLFRRSDQFDREQIVLEDLAGRGYAPAIHQLGTVQYEEGNYLKALELFKYSKDLGYLIGGTAYYAAKRREAIWPLSWVYLVFGMTYRLRSLLLKAKMGASDESSLWERKRRT